MKYAKSLDPNIKTLIIVPDLPQYTYINSGRPVVKIKNLLGKKKVLRAISKWSPCVDLWGLFSEHMKDEIRICKNYFVMEGIASDMFKTVVSQRINGNYTFDILYAGGLVSKYGVSLLLEAFEMIGDPDIRLVIAGKGELQRQIENIAEKDHRVQYLGEIDRIKLLSLEAGADLLINPRINSGIFTRYSFPSKNMEYLSSGTPMLGYKLDGISDIYDDYINYFKEPTAECLASSIMELKSSYEYAKNKAMFGKRFVLENKNKYVWGEKILNLIDETDKQSG